MISRSLWVTILWMAMGPAERSAVAAQEQVDSTRWSYGVEMGTGAAGLIRWEAARAGWLFGAGAGVGRGDEQVRARATPTLRVGRTLPAGLRIDGGLGLEWALLDRAYNDTESEIQWELTGGWAWASTVRAEAGVRWTDYHTPRREGVLRLSLAGARSPMPARPAEVPEALPRLGVPAPLTSKGRVEVPVDAPRHAGRGVVGGGANPRGDPAPGMTGGTNIDRLGGGVEAWSAEGPWTGWARWRSDLHTDPSISERLRPVAEGLSFPVSVSFSGGARWRPPGPGDFGVALRHDPQVFLWIPHLAAERTATVSALDGDASHRDLAIRVRALRLGRVPGQAVEPLRHTYVQAAHGSGTTMGAEHEVLTFSDRRIARTRAVVERTGRFSGRVAAGNDLSLAAGAALTVRSWEGEARVGYRSRPELLDYDALLARGWLREDGRTDALDGTPVIEIVLSAARGPVSLVGATVWNDPMWMGNAVRPGRAGYAYAAWADTVAAGRIEGSGRVALGRWGSRYAWWRDEPVAEATARIHLIDEALRLSALMAGRTALVSARSALEERGGAEIGVALAGPLPQVGPLGGMLGQARLDDVLDVGLPARVGAPLRGRRLTLLVTLISGGTM